MSKLVFYDSEIFIDYYDALNVNNDSSIEEIKESYFSLVKKYHPDQGGSDALFRKINEAYEILSNEEHKKEYDAYYIQKNTDAFNNDEYIRLRAQHHEYVDENKKELTKDEYDKLYSDIILTIQQENKQKVDDEKMSIEDISNKIDDLQYERKNADDEESNNKLYNLLENMNKNVQSGESKYTVSDLFEFYKNNNNNNNNNGQLITQSFMGINEINNNENAGFSFWNEDLNGASNSSFYSFYGEQHGTEKQNVNDFVNNINTDEFTKWKSEKRNQNKITDCDLEKLIKNRRDVELEINNKIEKSLDKHKEIMNMVDGGDEYTNNLKFFNNYKNPFENDLYGAIEKEHENLNDINDIKNTDGEFKINIDDNIDEVKNFIKKTCKTKHEKKDSFINDNDISKLINDRKNITNLLYDEEEEEEESPDVYSKPVLSNIIKRKGKYDNDISMQKYSIPAESNSKFRNLIKANNHEKLEKDLDLNIKNNLGSINDFYL
jgi:curved DNA-binding protein CbpA